MGESMAKCRAVSAGLYCVKEYIHSFSYASMVIPTIGFLARRLSCRASHERGWAKNPLYGGLSLLGACGSHAVRAPRVGPHVWCTVGAASRRRRSGGCTP
jgi:hypothetical protein